MAPRREPVRPAAGAMKRSHAGGNRPSIYRRSDHLAQLGAFNQLGKQGGLEETMV